MRFGTRRRATPILTMSGPFGAASRQSFQAATITLGSTSLADAVVSFAANVPPSTSTRTCGPMMGACAGATDAVSKANATAAGPMPQRDPLAKLRFASMADLVLCHSSADPLCSLTIVGTEHSAQPLTALDRPNGAFWHPMNQGIAQSLMGSFKMVVLDILFYRSSEMRRERPPREAEVRQYTSPQFPADFDRFLEDALLLGNLIESSDHIADVLRLDVWPSRPQLFEVWVLLSTLKWLFCRGYQIELLPSRDIMPLLGPCGSGADSFALVLVPRSGAVQSSKCTT